MERKKVISDLKNLILNGMATIANLLGETEKADGGEEYSIEEEAGLINTYLNLRVAYRTLNEGKKSRLHNVVCEWMEDWIEQIKDRMEILDGSMPFLYDEAVKKETIDTRESLNGGLLIAQETIKLLKEMCDDE